MEGAAVGCGARGVHRAVLACAGAMQGRRGAEGGTARGARRLLRQQLRTLRQQAPRSGGVCGAASAASAMATSYAEGGVATTADGKKIETQVVREVARDTLSVRSLDWGRERFDIEFGLEEGTTYNSYLISGADKTALVDASHRKFETLWMDTLRAQLGPGGLAEIDYLVVSHTEPDHSALALDVLRANPDATVVGSKVCISFLEELVNFKFKHLTVKGGDEVDLGGGHVLEFVVAPNLHWPDTLFTYDRGTGVLYTCDAFGLHYCSADPWDTDVDALLPHYKFYYDCLMKPNARSVLTALRKCSGLDVGLVANGHGPMLKHNMRFLMDSYEGWSNEATAKGAPSVAVMYTAGYGESDRLANTIAKGVSKTGAALEMADLRSEDPQELAEMVARASAVVVMAPPKSNAAAQDNLSMVLSASHAGMAVLVAESYGGEDEPVDALNASFVAQGLDAISAPLKLMDAPTEKTYQTFEEVGTDLGQSLTLKATNKKKKDSGSGDTLKALGRLSGGLYIMTARRGDSSTAMLASWVSQASFEPLGFTVAVAKDRAIESFMQVGDAFVLNVLEEGNASHLMKHFLTRFPPGADRFEGVDLVPSARCAGAPILREALAYVECQVQSRADLGDHWLIYSECLDGNVSSADKVTAVHHRKTGVYY